MEELIKRLERVIATGAPDKDGMHPISAETVLEVVKGLSEHGTNLASLGMDCISRQQAIEAVEFGITYVRSINTVTGEVKELFQESNDELRKAVERVRQLSPIQPKRGKWVYQIGMIKCDQCLRAIRRIDHDGLLNFCPNCGADMRGEKE